jgi:E3 ubiquitin-protein ligase RNF38/44
MLAVVGAALLVVVYARLVSRVFRAARRRWRRRRLRLLTLPGSPDSFTTYDNYYHTFSPYRFGLDEAAIKSLPSAQFPAAPCSSAARECAVCLLEFAGGDELRALPLCAHAFHADCVDVWLRAHASCPLCRAAVALPPPVASSPLRAAPRRAARPSLDDLLFFHPVPPPPPFADGGGAVPEIAPAADSPDRPLDPRDFLLKRSYSLGFERSLAPEAASPPWRFRAADVSAPSSRGGRGSFWSKRWPSPFGGGSRVFSFRSAAANKSSPFSRRRGAAATGAAAGSGFFFMSLASEPPSILAAARRSRAASSRLRCGDPEALLSPDRLGSR